MTDPATSTLKRSKRRIALAWILVLFWGGLIWLLGGDDFSFADTTDTIFPWLDWLTGNLDYRTRYRIFIAIRKSAHFFEYAILALLTFRAALLAAPQNRLATAGWIAVSLVAALASADEVRQAFSPVRTGSAYDVLLDLAGGLIAILGVLMVSRRVRQNSSDSGEPPDPRLEASS